MRGRDPVDGRRRVGLHICLERRLRGVVAAVRYLSVQREVHEQGVERGVQVEVYKRIATCPQPRATPPPLPVFKSPKQAHLLTRTARTSYFDDYALIVIIC